MINVYILDSNNEVVSSLIDGLSEHLDKSRFNTYHVKHVFDLPTASLETPPDVVVLDIHLKGGIDSYCAWESLGRKDIKVFIHTDLDMSEIEKGAEFMDIEIPESFTYVKKSSGEITSELMDFYQKHYDKFNEPKQELCL